MKKILILFFAIILILVPMSVSAAPTNYAEGLNWQKGLCAQILANGLDVEMRGITSSFNSAFIDILPAMKKALGNNNAVTVTISAKIKAVFSEAGAESHCRPALRAHIGIKDPQTWTNLYKQTLNGDNPFFTSETSNVMTGIGTGIIPLKEDWSAFSFDISATKNQINSFMTPNWYFCFDGINLQTSIGAIFIKDLTITLKNHSAGSSTQTTVNTPTPTPKLTQNPAQIQQTLPMRTANIINPFAPKATPTPTPTPTPAPTPNPNWIMQPLMFDMMAMVYISLNVFSLIFVVMGIVYLITKIRERKNKR